MVRMYGFIMSVIESDEAHRSCSPSPEVFFFLRCLSWCLHRQVHSFPVDPILSLMCVR